MTIPVLIDHDAADSSYYAESRFGIINSIRNILEGTFLERVLQKCTFFVPFV